MYRLRSPAFAPSIRNCRAIVVLPEPGSPKENVTPVQASAENLVETFHSHSSRHVTLPSHRMGTLPNAVKADSNAVSSAMVP